MDREQSSVTVMGDGVAASAVPLGQRFRRRTQQQRVSGRRSATGYAGMKQAQREALDAYYREAGSWADDRNDALRGSRRVAWIIAGVAVVIALCEALALVFLAPLKTVVPYTLLVDKQTGYVQALQPLDEQKIAPDTALDALVPCSICDRARKLCVSPRRKTIIARPSYGSADSAKADYVGLMPVNNPASPLARLPRTTVIDTVVKSVSSLGKETALVRFDSVRRDASGQPLPAQPWVAVITYRYSTGPLRTDDRFLNPLGFQVTRYRRDQEALVPEATAAPTASETPAMRPQILILSGAAPLPQVRFHGAAMRALIADDAACVRQRGDGAIHPHCATRSADRNGDV